MKISAAFLVCSGEPLREQTLIHQAKDMARGGNIAAALVLLARAQQQDPLDSQTWQLACELAVHVRDWPELQRIALRWTAVQPASVAAWQALSQSHFEDSNFNEAISAFSRVLALAPGNNQHLVSAARLATAGQQFDLARAHLSAAHKLTPDSGEVLYALSRLHHQTGELDKAEHYCRSAIRVSPGFAPAYTALGVLTEGRLSQDEINTIAHLANNKAIHPEYRAMLSFTLGEALEHQAEFEHAFTAWQQANAINNKISEQEGIFYNAKQHEADVDILQQLFAESISLDIHTATNVQPIFIVGMPRSGTTLIESILASHSDVCGAGELPTLLDIHESLIDLARRQGIAAARHALVTMASSWRTQYLTALPACDKSSYVVDKQPLNFRAIGLIRVLFPNAPIIYTKRDAMDIGLSIYRHNFSKNWPCAHSLNDIGHYYGVHARIMALWQQRYVESIYVVDHAALVRDPAIEIRQLLAFANLEFEPACLTPHKTKRSVATFSSVQVQRPLSARYSGRAARYVEQLAPLRVRLEQMGC